MSLLLGLSTLPFLEVATAAAAEAEPDPNSGPAVQGYALIYNRPDQRAPGYGQGWTLTVSPPGPRPRTTSLTARGASVHAGPRVAKAVAARVLTEHGVAVAGWCDPAPSDEPGLTMFRARLCSATDLPTPGTPGSAAASRTLAPRNCTRALRF